jgi:hypothetical protein
MTPYRERREAGEYVAPRRPSGPEDTLWCPGSGLDKGKRVDQAGGAMPLGATATLAA